MSVLQNDDVYFRQNLPDGSAVSNCEVVCTDRIIWACESVRNILVGVGYIKVLIVVR